MTKTHDDSVKQQREDTHKTPVQDSSTSHQPQPSEAGAKLTAHQRTTNALEKNQMPPPPDPSKSDDENEQQWREQKQKLKQDERKLLAGAGTANLRDNLAATAMHFVFDNHTIDDAFDESLLEGLCARAYRIADAMLKMR